MRVVVSAREEGRAQLAALEAGLAGLGVTPWARPIADDETLYFEVGDLACTATWNGRGTLSATVSNAGADALLAALAATRTCTVEPADGWDEDIGVYTCSACGEPWQFTYEGPAGNGWACCPRCRARIVEGAAP